MKARLLERMKKQLRKRLRMTPQFLWTAKKTNDWVLNTARVKRKLSETVKARKLAYCGHTMKKQGSCLEKEIMQGTMPGARKRGRPRTVTHGLDGQHQDVDRVSQKDRGQR